MPRRFSSSFVPLTTTTIAVQIFLLSLLILHHLSLPAVSASGGNIVLLQPGSIYPGTITSSDQSDLYFLSMTPSELTDDAVLVNVQRTGVVGPVGGNLQATMTLNFTTAPIGDVALPISLQIPCQGISTSKGTPVLLDFCAKTLCPRPLSQILGGGGGAPSGYTIRISGDGGTSYNLQVTTQSIALQLDTGAGAIVPANGTLFGGDRVNFFIDIPDVEPFRDLVTTTPMRVRFTSNDSLTVALGVTMFNSCFTEDLAAPAAGDGFYLTFTTEAQITLSWASRPPLSTGRWFFSVAQMSPLLLGDTASLATNDPTAADYFTLDPPPGGKPFTIAATFDSDPYWRIWISTGYVVVLMLGVFLAVVIMLIRHKSLNSASLWGAMRYVQVLMGVVEVGVGLQTIQTVLSRVGPRGVMKALEDRFATYVVTIALIMLPPSAQIVLSKLSQQDVTASLDICYFNELCTSPQSFFKGQVNLHASNNVISNIVFAVNGFLFIVYTSYAGNHSPEFSVARSPSLYTAFGLLLMFEGIFSALYHICE